MSYIYCLILLSKYKKIITIVYSVLLSKLVCVFVSDLDFMYRLYTIA